MPKKTLTATGKMGAGMTIEIMCGEHKVYMDQPVNAGGANRGPAPPELILAAYAGCVGSIGRIIAFQEKLEIRGMEFEIEADYNSDKLLGRETTERAGFTEVRLKVDIDCDLNPEEKQKLLERIEERCPILDNLVNETKVISRLA